MGVFFAVQVWRWNEKLHDPHTLSIRPRPRPAQNGARWEDGFRSIGHVAAQFPLGKRPRAGGWNQEP